MKPVLCILTIVYSLLAGRYYDPEVGLWISVDPMNEFFSPYTYAGNNPIRYTDPTGLLSSDEVQKFVEGTGTTNIDANLLLLAEHTIGLENDVTTGADLRTGLENAGVKGESIFPLANVKSIVTEKGQVSINFIKAFAGKVEGVGYMKLDKAILLNMSETLKFSVESGMKAKPIKLSPWIRVNQLQLKDATKQHILNVRTVTGISKDVNLPKVGG